MRLRRRSRAADDDAVVIEAVDTVSSPTAAEPVDPNDLGAVDVERALRLVRMAAALIAMAAVIGARGQDGPGLHGPAAAAAIFAGALAINLFTSWTSRRGWTAVTSLGGQVLDVAGSLALVVLLDQALDGSAWMVMLLPIVMGGVRFGASGTLLAWTLACAGYLALVLTGAISIEGTKAEEFGASLQRFAFLLALAVPVAALTQWLQQRWEHQRGLTVAASLRAQRLELIESLARSFLGSSEPKLLANVADAGVQLGFSTVTITLLAGDRAMTVAAVGESRYLPTDDVTIRPEPGETLVTHWQPEGGSESLTSVSILLDASGNPIALHGWSPDDVDENLARSFGLLGAHAGVALQAARLLADLERQANHDPLTGLLNRRAFDEHIDRQVGVANTVALLFLDVDHFKHINDTYGHPGGDKVLRLIAERLRTAAASAGPAVTSAVARVGGDEFAVLLTNAPLEAVAHVADRIESSMQEPVAIGEAAVPVSFSIGIADAEAIWVPRELFEAADEATYQAKSHGRNRSCWAPGPVGQADAAVPDPRRIRPGNIESGRSAHLDPVPGDSLISLIERSMDTSTVTTPPTPTPTTRPPQ